MSNLPTDPKSRKQCPVGTGVLDYFPKALAAVAYVSYVGNLQHNGPDAPLHWDRSKSADEADAAIRHFLERGKLDSDGTRHTAKAAWRLLAMLEKELEAEDAKVPGLDISSGSVTYSSWSGPVIEPYVKDGTVRVVKCGPADIKSNYPNPGYCELHEVYLDTKRRCPADPGSDDYGWWNTSGVRTRFEAKQAAESESCI